MYFDLLTAARVVDFFFVAVEEVSVAAGVVGGVVGVGGVASVSAGEGEIDAGGVVNSVGSTAISSVAFAGLANIKLEATMLHVAKATSDFRNVCFDI